MRRDEKTTREEGIISSGMQDQTQKGSSDIIQAGVHRQDKLIPSGVQVPSTKSVEGDLMLNNERYTILKQLAVSGEAEVFLVQKRDGKFVVKLYYPKFVPKMEVVQQLKGLKYPDIIALLDFGWLENRFFEIMEYAEGGSLVELVPIKSPQTLKHIVEEVVDALHFCHSQGIIHRDIKPQNIYFRDAARTDVVIGDFGIATALVEGYSKKITTMAMTPVYAAPETFMGKAGKTIIDKAIDYYALGMALIHLWTGKPPFEGLSEYTIIRAKMEGKIPIPDDLPREFQTLLKGLLTLKPDKRWGYEEVQRWLRGETVPVHYEEKILEYPVFVFGVVQGNRLEAADPVTLADLMEAHPELGMKHLYKKAVSKWLQPIDQYLYTMMESIVEDEYPKDPEAGLTKAIYLLDPEKPFKGVDGGLYETSEEIAECLERNFDHYQEELKKVTAPLYLYLEARGYKEEVDKFRKLFEAKIASSKAALNVLILWLEGSKVLKVGKHRFVEPKEILDADIAIQKKLASDLADPYSKVSLWLQAFPHLNWSLDRWRSLKRYEPGTLRYAFGEGFVINNKIVKNTENLKAVIRNDPLALQPKQVNELNYWLKNYLDTSLNQILLDLASEQGIDVDSFIALSTNALHNFDDRDLHVFDVLDRLMDLVDRKWWRDDDRKTERCLVSGNS